MQAALIAISTVLGICLLALGLIIGFLVKENLYSYKGYTHPEMFDQNGNILPDEILAVRFENSYDDYYETEDDEE
ncbi:hypothetical protein PQC12_gp193 [Synechococcus phage S-SCSM1]|uniref:Uncharacterized protein n=1 Tax=Synechococcus phage S-SCSM1 TaxID=2588487 RepID=A0A6M2ZHS6_9CAUD|nr:hypothetical protein PQC12_gp193 [Synechococcus phage S-SCSM1]QFG06442.1 hypothetical protein SSCSM1_179 [Synechococcus phage S-SCSM1]